MAQPMTKTALNRPRPIKNGMPPSRSGERLHLGGESSSSAAPRLKGSRAPASRTVADSKSLAARRALGDVSNFDKNSSHVVHEAGYIKPAAQMRAAPLYDQGEEAFRHKSATNVSAARREAKSRDSASSATSGSTSGGASVRQIGGKRVRTTASLGPRSSANTRAGAVAAESGLRQAASQPDSLLRASSIDAQGAFATRSTSEGIVDQELEELARQVVDTDTDGATDGAEDEDMDGADSDPEMDSISEECSNSAGTPPLDDAASITSAEGDVLNFSALDPEGYVTLSPEQEALARRNVAWISHRYFCEVIMPYRQSQALARQEAVREGTLHPDVAAADDELAAMGLDPEDVRDLSMCAEYSEEIFGVMGALELETLANPHYVSYQNEIQWHMRTTLIDWLLQVHMRYHLLPETLWIAVNIIDRFLSVRVVSLKKLQLVGVTAMFIAAKYEEIVAPSVEEFVFMTEGGYSKEEIFKGERIVLSTLDFKISGYCSPYSWMRKISKADDYDIQVRTLAKFLIEVTLLDHRFLRAKPSLIAAIGMYLSKKMLHGDWHDGFVFYSGFCEEQLIPGANLLLSKLADPTFGEHFVCRKYANKKFLKASVYARDWAMQQSDRFAARDEQAQYQYSQLENQPYMVAVE